MLLTIRAGLIKELRVKVGIFRFYNVAVVGDAFPHLFHLHLFDFIVF